MKAKVIILFVLAFILRLVLIPTAYHGDLNNNWSWGKVASEYGLNGFYGNTSDSDNWEYSAPNQPPLYILYFTGVYKIYSLLNTSIYYLNNSISVFPSTFVWWWEAFGKIYTLKLGSVIADLGIGLVIYKYLKLNINNLRSKVPIIVTLIWLFNPIAWYNSAVWGGTDSIVNLLGLISVLNLLDKKLIKFSVLFTLAFLFKPSLAIFVPIQLLIIWKEKYSVKLLLHTSYYILFTTILVSVWFHPNLDLPIWMFNLFTTRIFPGEIGYLTANAFNFWWLVDSGKTIDLILYFGISARVWGFVICGLGITFILNRLWKLFSHPGDRRLIGSDNTKDSIASAKASLQNDKLLFLLLSIVSLLSFLFMTRIHERYLYPFFPYATLLLGLIPGFVVPYILLSFTFLLNMYHLFWAPDFIDLKFLYLNALFMKTISLINISIIVILLRQFTKQSYNHK